MPEPWELPHFTLGVVGSDEGWHPDALKALFDRLMGRYMGGTHYLILIGPADCPAYDWAKNGSAAGTYASQKASVHLAPYLPGEYSDDPRENQAREIAEKADALVVVGDPRRWRRLLTLARAKGIPARVVSRPPDKRRGGSAGIPADPPLFND